VIIIIKIKKNRAYTLVEVALVMLIMGLSYGMISPAYFHMVDKAKSESVIDEVKEIETKIDEFYADNGKLPDSLNEVFESVPLDPWGNPYEYLRINGGNIQGKGKLRKDKNLVPINSDYDLYSMGPDGKSVSPLTGNSSKDDIVRGRNGGFIGVAIDY
jgi:general secretion pathway protein G